VLILILASGCAKEQHVIPPEITTVGVVVITPINAICSGTVSNSGNSHLIEKGICWSTEPLPTVIDERSVDTSLQDFGYTCSISPLTSNTIYYFRAYASGEGGAAYGNELSFRTPVDLTGEKETISDIDGNLYHAIGIGSQIWTVENLRTTRLNNGTEIGLAKCFRLWSVPLVPAYCYYNSDDTNRRVYGVMYNWYTVNTGLLCPAGWHVPQESEWTILETFLGSNETAGGKLKETGNEHWNTPNTGAINVSGFTGLPGGFRDDSAIDYDLNVSSIFWTSTAFDSNAACYRSLASSSGSLFKGGFSRASGAYVRCVKNQ
jgi:uncharacterized protein (TIGR02145 family)